MEGLEDYVTETNTEERLTFENVVGQDSLTRFDRPKRKKNKKRKNRNHRTKNQKNKAKHA